MKRIKDIMMKDVWWKILSLIIAAMMWFMVININQPIDTRIYTKTISVENLKVLSEKGLTISNMDEILATKVSVKIKAQRTALDRLSGSKDWLNVNINVNNLAGAVDSDVVVVPIDVSMVGIYSGYSIEGKSPMAIEVNIEKVISREFDLETQINGETSPNTLLTKANLSERSVTVTGARSKVSNIEKVKLNINASDIADKAILKIIPIAYNANGNQVKGIEINPKEITVSYTALATKEVFLTTNIEGNPAEGFSVEEIKYNPDKVFLIGDAETLSGISYVTLPQIDIDFATSDVKRSFKLNNYLPSGVQSEGDITVTVTAVIKGDIGYNYDLPFSQVYITGEKSGLKYSFPQSTKIILLGEKSKIDAMDTKLLRVTLNVGDISTPGNYLIEGDISSLPEGVTVKEALFEVGVSNDE